MYLFHYFSRNPKCCSVESYLRKSDLQTLACWKYYVTRAATTLIFSHVLAVLIIAHSVCVS